MAMRRWQDLTGDASVLIATTVAPGITALRERALAPIEQSLFYLAEGRDRDCLIDGGWGFCRSLDGLRPDPTRPLIAVATHSHFDHVGALHLADEIAVHAAEAAILADPEPVATQALPYLDGRAVLADGGSIDPATVAQTPCARPRTIGEGEVVDLGNRRLRVLHVPGHSPGSLALLDEANGLLFCADTVHDGQIWDDIPGADRAALAMSHRRLMEVDFAAALPGHGAVLSRQAFRARVERYRREQGLREG
jgi:glyoxylase-like metal-dependent hydrolase (beta-lactamase superfamily II)